MNGPELLTCIRDQLACAVAERGSPPPAAPLNISSWVAMSLLQKAIRRGHENLALAAAAALLRIDPDRLWRRLGCIRVIFRLGPLIGRRSASAKNFREV